MRSPRQKEFSQPAPENPRDPDTRPPIPTMSSGLNRQAYPQWPDSSINYDNGQFEEVDQYGHDEAAFMTSLLKNGQPEETIAGATPTSRGHTRKSSKNLRTTFGLGRKKDNAAIREQWKGEDADRI